MARAGLPPTIWPFACRTKEIGEIEGEGALPHRVAVFGDAGVGKSRLLSEVLVRAASNGHRTVHVVGTRSLASVPFGAFAGVLEGSLPDRGSRFDVLRLALQDLVGSSEPENVLLAVDDANLLDDASAGLVLLAAQSGCGVIAAIRRGESCPDAITLLWTNDFVSRLDLRPLDREEVGEVLAAALGAPVDSHTRHRLSETTRGNLLFLREVVRSALASGSLVEHDDIWTLTGSYPQVPAVHDLLTERVAALDPAVRGIVDIVAVGEPLGAALVARLGSADALEMAEREGMVTVDQLGARQDVRLVHPLYAEVLRDRMGKRCRTEISKRIAVALSRTGKRRSDDALRIATLQLDAGTPPDPVIAVEAARLALLLADLHLAQRLARAAYGATGEVPAALLLAEALYWEGRFEDVMDLLGNGVLDAAPPAERAAGCMHVASSLFWGMGKLEDAEAWLERGEQSGPPFELELRGQHAEMLMFAGRALDSIEVGRSVLDRDDATPLARLRAYSGVLPSLAMCGRLDEVEADLFVALELAMTGGPDTTNESGGIIVACFVSSLFAGNLEELDALVVSLHEESIRRVDDPFRGVWALLLGRSALAQGRLDRALTLLREAAAVFRGRDPGSILPWALASIAQVCGMTGDGRGADQAMHELDAVRIPSLHGIDVEAELGRAWAQAAGGARRIPQRIAFEIGLALAQEGKHALATLALHDALRLGADARELLPPMTASAGASQGPVPHAMATHVAGTAGRDLSLLGEAGDAFDTAGMALLAAEVYAEASHRAGEQGLRSQQRESAIRSRELAALCGPAHTPLLETVTGRESLASLTRREQEVALMACRGLSKRQIAEALHISQRTVGNHINHVYGKLSISSRAELRILLSLDSEGAF